MPPPSCPGCTFVNPEGFRFCGRCGTWLGEDGAPSAPEPRAERRQVTVLFSDLVGSTALSRQLDPEDLRRVIRGYQLVCEPVIERHGGYISRFLGDGILAYFGYPIAREDDAAHAVRAGLDIVAALAESDPGLLPEPDSTLSVRIGIATGLVVAGDLIGKGAAEEEVVFGETPNLAARLQSLAEPDTVLIGERTRRLIGEQFELRALPAQRLKGFAEPVDVWQVLEPARRSLRFDARRLARTTPLIDRQNEIEFLLDRWSESRLGRARVALVSGEPGIGKSRLIDALRQRIAGEPHLYLLFQCAAQSSNTALHPLIASLEHRAGFERRDSPEERGRKLDAIVDQESPLRERLRAALRSLLGLPGPENDPFERLDARERRQRTFATLIETVRTLCDRCPTLIVVEDLHWIDASSLELLELAWEELRELPLFLILTRRSDTGVTLRTAPDADQISLLRFDAAVSRALVHEAARDESLPDELVQHIVEKADGVPLFIEELTRTLLLPKFAGAGADTSVAIPDTLHDSLMARLDQLSPGKRVAQIASILGRDFALDLLHAVADIDAALLDGGLAQLSAAGLLLESGSGPGARYRFKHALVRDTAYDSLLREERRRYHRLTAVAIAHDPATNSPELLAHHYTEGAMEEEAIGCWLEAGRRSARRSALVEAVEHFQAGLALLRRRPRDAARDALQLEYLVDLGPAMIATHGSGAEETEAVYARAIELCESLPVSETHFTALWGWWRIAKDLPSKARRAARLQTLADEIGSDALKLQAHHCFWPTRLYLGEHRRALEHIHDGLALYDHGDYRADAARYGGHDARSCGLGNAAQALWLRGFPEQAVRRMEEARLWAERLEQVGSLVNVMDANLLLLRYRNEAALAARQADELDGFARTNRLAEYEAKAQVFRGWARARLGEPEVGVALMREGIDRHMAIGTNEDPPVWREMLAEGYLLAGDHALGLDAIDEAFRHVERSGLAFWIAELHRQRGELLRRLEPTRADRARECFARARAIAHGQGARALELRALLSMLRLERDAGEEARTRAANTALRALAARFEEGSDSTDLVAARAALDPADAAAADTGADTETDAPG